MKGKLEDQDQPQVSGMQPVKWKIRIKSPNAQAVYEIEGSGPGIWDCPELLDRSTAYIGGARDQRFADCGEWPAVV